MSTLIIAQNEAKLRGQLNKYRAPGSASLVQTVRLSYKLDMDVLNSPSGEPVYALYMGSAAQIVRAIIKFADAELANQQNDVVTVRIVFMFHQTHKSSAKKIFLACRRLPQNPGWRRLPYMHTKHLRVTPVVMLSCESGMDKVFQPGPNPPTPKERAMRNYAAQARGMRIAAGQGFITPMAPPPDTPQGWYDPEIITFTTGDPNTGGVVLDPFRAQFKQLPGDFRDDGSWSYDPTPAGQNQDVFRSGVDTAGTVHSDSVNSGTTSSTDIPSGGSIPIIP